jgi:TolB protein
MQVSYSRIERFAQFPPAAADNVFAARHAVTSAPAMTRLLRLLAACCALALLPFSAARAQLTIEIVGGAGSQIPIAIVPFEGESNFPLGISGITGADLQRSGLFRMVDPMGVTPRPGRADDVQPAVWRARSADAVAVGSMRPLGDGRVEVRFGLVDVVKQQTLAAMVFTVTQQQFRATAHKIADVIYEKLTGDAGVFSTRIAYITKSGPRYQLLVADADGYDPQVVVTSQEPLLTPKWSPDGTRLAYVSFENRKPVVYVQSLSTGERRAVANYRGSNSAPAWSPDGRRLAVTLTKDGPSQIYLMNADGSGLTRVMTSQSIDTEAAFSPDGQWLLFTSDRGGTPQVYRTNLVSGAVERLTFEGNYNVTPRPMPDGTGFVYVRREGGSRFQLAYMDYATRQTQILTPGPGDESPSIAPNSKMIIYASETGARGILAAVSSDGRVKQRLVAPATDVREPAWGPLPRS